MLKLTLDVRGLKWWSKFFLVQFTGDLVLTLNIVKKNYIKVALFRTELR